MINRELIRIKVVQLTYAYYQNGSKNIDSAEQVLMASLSKAYEMYALLLALIVAVTREERRRQDLLTQQAEREGSELPSMKFGTNKFAMQLERNKMLLEIMDERHLSWDDDVEMVRKLCTLVQGTDLYKDYVASTQETSYEDDRELWRRLYKQLIENNEDLDAFFEEKNIYWNDDKTVVDTFVLKTIKRFDPANKSKQELLPEFRDPEDEEFARKLFRATILNADTYQRYMSDTARNWDFSRMAYMDIVIMQIAIAELLNFPAIPVSVSINEYVDLAKLYSTPQSGRFLNGMLDAIARHLNEMGLMHKPMEERTEGKVRFVHKGKGEAVMQSDVPVSEEQPTPDEIPTSAASATLPETDEETEESESYGA